MEDLANYVHFRANSGTLRGNLATLAFDIDLMGECFESDNPAVPVFHLWGKSLRGKKIDIGAIWQQRNAQGATIVQ